MKKKLQECVEGLSWALFQPFLMFQVVKNSDLFFPVRGKKEEGVENSSSPEADRDPLGWI